MQYVYYKYNLFRFIGKIFNDYIRIFKIRIFKYNILKKKHNSMKVYSFEGLRLF